MPQQINSGMALTDRETQALQGCEAVIKRGLKTFYEVGTALLTIRDRLLYRTNHDSFESYCWERWNISRPQAYRLIEAATVSDNLSPIGDIVPTRESQLRPLTSLEPEEQRSVWQQAVAESNGKQPTATKVREVVEAHVKSKVPTHAEVSEARDSGSPSGGSYFRRRMRQEAVEQIQAALKRMRKSLPWLTPKARALLAPELRLLLETNRPVVDFLHALRAEIFEKRHRGKMDAQKLLDWVERELDKLDNHEYRTLHR